MFGQRGFSDAVVRYKKLSDAGDPLEKIDGVVDWKLFCNTLSKALKCSNRTAGARGDDVQDPGALGFV